MKRVSCREAVEVTAFGRTQTVKEWAEETGLKAATIYQRLFVFEWEPERAVMKGAKDKDE